MLWKIKVVAERASEKDRETLIFAAEELKKYLLQCVKDEIIICIDDRAGSDALRLGVGISEDTPKVEDAYYDDGFDIAVSGRVGYISGTNARSVLIAVYRYLGELGYSFIRPGKEGERKPCSLELKEVALNEVADHRYRMICLEGSEFYEAIEDVVDWIPKAGMNGFYTQFFTPWIFFKRWYHHEGYEFKNPYLAPEPLTVEDVEGMVKCYERQIGKRGIIYEKVGHGWTCDPFGMTSLGWESVPEDSIPREACKYFALIDGKRGIHKSPGYDNVPLVTQLCYSNPEVRERMVTSFVDYCRSNPRIDIVGFALADGGNNHCECPECSKLRVSDFKLMIVNEINRRLKAEGIRTKVNFDVYVDGLWTPIREKFDEDQSGLLMHLAPISRTYTRPFPHESKATVREYVRNKLVFPESVEELWAYMNEWKKLYHGELCCFDYYYMWDCYKDMGMTETARVIHQDVANYRNLNLNGIISCQSQRVFCPTSLGMNVMARTLWNRSSDFDTVRDEVLEAEYGADFALVRDYLQDLSIYGLPEVIRMEKPLRTEESLNSYLACLERIRGFLPVIEEHLATASEECCRVSWKNLRFHSEITSALTEMLIAVIRGEDYLPMWQSIEDFVNRHELEFKQYFDAFEFKRTYGRMLPDLVADKKEVMIY